MKDDRLSQQLRAARRRLGLTQTALARISGVGRVTIARLEGGSSQDLRAGTLARLCGALGLEMAAVPSGRQARLERAVARAEERARRAERRLAHVRLAAQLLSAPRSDAEALIAQARSVVDRWERDGLCSRHYVSRWRKLLAGPVGRVAQGLLGSTEWTDALLQNTPWSFAVGVPTA